MDVYGLWMFMFIHPGIGAARNEYLFNPELHGLITIPQRYTIQVLP